MGLNKLQLGKKNFLHPQHEFKCTHSRKEKDLFCAWGAEPPTRLHGLAPAPPYFCYTNIRYDCITLKII